VTIHGVDVSDYQCSWKPNSAGAGDDQFVFIKASEGQSWKADCAGDLAKRGRDEGLVVGWYHFLWPSSASGSPATQAEWFLDCARGFGLCDGDVLWCDWEGTGGGTPTGSDKDKFIDAVMDKVGDRNKVGLYVNYSMWSSSNKNRGDALWLAQYASSASTDAWDFWQYTSSPLDQNKAKFGSRDELREWAGGSSSSLLGLTTVEKFSYTGA
jgi:GH25 family lysozyme M1 (1,4-beta-N-acetylmuramidase)